LTGTHGGKLKLSAMWIDVIDRRGALPNSIQTRQPIKNKN